MKAFNVSLAVLVLSFASTSFAKDSRHVAKIRSALKNRSMTMSAVRPIAPQCADFSGKWQGVCTEADGTTDEATLNITQEDCSSIYLDGINVDINGGVTVASSPAPDSEFPIPVSVSVGMSWNDSQTRLQQLTNLNIGYSMGGVIKSSMWLAGDQLRVKDDKATALLSIDGTSDWNLVLTDCTYDRVP